MKAQDLICLGNLSSGIFRAPELRYQGGSAQTPPPPGGYSTLKSPGVIGLSLHVDFWAKCSFQYQKGYFWAFRPFSKFLGEFFGFGDFRHCLYFRIGVSSTLFLDKTLYSYSMCSAVLAVFSDQKRFPQHRRRREVHHDHKTEFQMQLTTLLLASPFYIQSVYTL